MSDARAEAETVIFACLDALFAACPVLRPSDVDVLIVNCSLFAPTPSLASMVVNRYRMRTDVQSYNLGGMGCSAGVIAVHLCRELLQVRRFARCLVVSTEVITQSIHLGRTPALLLSNALFRCGGCAQLYSNRWSDRHLSGLSRLPPCRFALLWSSRTHLGRDERAYRCVYQQEDEEGFKGVHLGKDLMDVAARAIREHLSHNAHRLLSVREMARFAVWAALRIAVRAALGVAQRSSGPPSSGDAEREAGKHPGEQSASATAASASLSSSLLASLQYSPTFSRASLHPCIHAGGSGVLTACQAALRLSDADVEVARRVLHDHGNVSSASVFYELHALERQRRARHADPAASRRTLRKGDSVWLLAFGSGFKVNSAVLQAI